MPEPKSRTATQTQAARERFSPFAVCLVLVLLTLGVYWPTTSHDFVDYDDGDYVVGNRHVQDGLTWAGVKWAFTSGHASNWHPLTWLSHQADVSLFGQKAGGHHLTSLLMHVANVVLVFLAVRALTGANWRSAVVAGLFALHPLHVESVAWVSERKDVLSTMFGLLTVLAYGRYIRTPKCPVAGGAVEDNPRTTHHASRWYLLSLALFALGLMSKPMLVTLPFVLCLLDYWPLGRVPGFKFQDSGELIKSKVLTTWSRLVMEKLPFLLLCVASSIATFLVQQHGGAVSRLESVPIGARLGNAFVAYVRYLKKTFWPDDLSVLYPHPGYWPIGMVVAAALVVLGISLLAIWRRREWPFLFVGWFWFAGMLVPVIGIVQVGLQSMADRYTYLPHVGLFIALVWGASQLGEARAALRPVLAGLAGLAVLGCAVVTWFQVGIWRNTETLFTRAVQVTKNNYLAHNNLGFYYGKQGRTKDAEAAYRASLKINPNYADANNNLGHALANEGKHAEAIAYYRVALRSSPNNVEIRNNLGNALAETGDLAGAIKEYQFVLEREPEHADAHNNFGIALAMLGRFDEATTHFQRSLKAKPANAGALGNLGNAYAAQRRFAEAIPQYQAALALSPNDPQTWNNLGNVLSELGRLDEAVSNYTAALQLKAQNPEAHFNLATALLRLGRPNDARTHLRETLRLRPDHAAARQQLEQLARQPE